MSENTIAKGLRWAAARGKINADNADYMCPVSIREAELAAGEIDALAARVARMREDLLKYGGHFDDCKGMAGALDERCTCGFREACLPDADSEKS